MRLRGDYFARRSKNVGTSAVSLRGASEALFIMEARDGIEPVPNCLRDKKNRPQLQVRMRRQIRRKPRPMISELLTMVMKAFGSRLRT